MLKLFFFDIKDKQSKIYIYFAYLVQLFIYITYIICKTQSDEFLQSFQYTQRAALIFFISIFFLSYEIFSDFQIREWKEVISISQRGYLNVLGSKILHVFSLLLIQCLCTVIIELIKLWRSGYADLLFGDVSRVLFLNFFMFPLMGIVLGQTFSILCKKKWSGYFAALIVILLGCGLFYRINIGLYMTTGVNLDSAFRFFQFEQPNADWVADYLYTVPAENYRFCLYGAWIFGGVFFLCLHLWGKKFIQIGTATVCAVLCILCVVKVGTAESCLNYDLNYGTPAAKQTEFENDSLPKEQAADFIVEKYTMDLCVSNELTANVVVAVKESNAGDYNFTLYRGYELTSVTNQNGNELDYERDKDYIVVHTSGDVSEIRMTYHGYQSSMYSNEQGIMLPGYFAYYPQPGFRKVFIKEIVDGGYLTYGFNVADDTLQETQYEITVEYDGEVCSNLDKEGNVFAGVTKAPTLMGGIVSESYQESGHYIYPTLAEDCVFSLEDIKESLETYCDRLSMDAEVFEQINQVIILPASVTLGNDWGENVIVGDCLFLGINANIDGLGEDILQEYMNVQGDKTLLESTLFSVLRNSMYLQDLSPTTESEFFSVSYDKTETQSEAYIEILEYSTLDRMYLMLLDEFDEKEVFRQTVEYLMDNEASENCAEFMQNLYLELEEKKE